MGASGDWQVGGWHLTGILPLDDGNLQPAMVGLIACDNWIGCVIRPPLAQQAAAFHPRAPDGI